MKKENLAANIYDILRGSVLPTSRTLNEWEQLTRKHADESAKEMRPYLKNKDLELNGNTIRIGKRIKIIID
jgi:hypothetical protein